MTSAAKGLEDILPVLPKNVGHLLKEPTEIDCPACHQHNVTRVEKEAVTVLQKFVVAINTCLCW